ncbi:hypothetical protein [Parvularcula sp. IMCC14364]|nr:hypothetical protein [Parvularcula sp. IMCC14364]
MKLLTLALLACFVLTACGKKSELVRPPLPGEQQQQPENQDD